MNKNTKEPVVKCFFTTGSQHPVSFQLHWGGKPILCSRKHFYLFGTKAKKVKVAKKECCKQIHDRNSSLYGNKVCVLMLAPEKRFCQWKINIILDEIYNTTKKNLCEIYKIGCCTYSTLFSYTSIITGKIMGERLVFL